MHTYMHAYKHTYKHTYIHTYKHTNKHTYIHSYIHACKHIHMHTYEHNAPCSRFHQQHVCQSWSTPHLPKSCQIVIFAVARACAPNLSMSHLRRQRAANKPEPCTCDVIESGLIILPFFMTTACAKRTGAAASVERKRREPARAISSE
jgi:hypothetical protein